MPLVYQQNINESTKLAVWHIAETEDFFLQKVGLPALITHPHKRLQHLAGRYLLPELFQDFPLDLIKIAHTRKPFLLNDLFHFSISHCGDYAAAIVSKSQRVGVDIEVISEKTVRLQDKFLSKAEKLIFNPEGNIPNSQLLTLAWSTKETLFKWVGSGGIDFKKHLQVLKMQQDQNQFILNCSINKNETIKLNVHGLQFNGNFLTWVSS